MDDLQKRLRHRVQLTSDGHRPYLEAVWEAGKIAGQYQDDRLRDLPCTRLEVDEIMRMSMRRYTRVTNAFPRSWRTTRRRSRCISGTTTSAASTRRFRDFGYPGYVRIPGIDVKYVAVSHRVQVHLPQQADEPRTVCLVHIEGGRRHAARLDSS